MYCLYFFIIAHSRLLHEQLSIMQNEVIAVETKTSLGAMYLFKDNMNFSLFTQFLGHNHYVIEKIKWLKV